MYMHGKNNKFKWNYRDKMEATQEILAAHHKPEIF